MNNTVYQIKRIADNEGERYLIMSEREIECIKVALEQLSFLSDEEFGSVNLSAQVLEQFRRLK